MKLIDAVWEKRNLGVTCQEIHLSPDDTTQQMARGISELSASYQVLRIPSGKTDLLLEAQKHGFSVIEMSIGLSAKMKDSPELPRIYRRFETVVDVTQATPEQQTVILQEIRSGTMFATDRIALDPCFSAKASGERYFFWAKDLIETRNGSLSCIHYKGEPVGFGLNYKMNDKTYNAALGGVFEAYARMGLGFLAIYANMRSIYDQGGRVVETSVSSNNLPILRLHELYGYGTNAMNYILVKHR